RFSRDWSSDVCSSDLLSALHAAFTANPSYRLAQNAVTRNNLDDIALDHRVVFNADHSFSVALDDWGVTDQKQTGRCWMFAGLNRSEERRVGKGCRSRW